MTESQKKKIFIVEDHPQNVELYLAIFNKIENVETFIEMDGEKGFEMIQAGDPDLIILDNKLPKINGLNICKKLRTLEKFKDTPIIAVSSSPISGNKEEIFASAGFNKLITKPIKISEFRTLILSYIS